MKPPDNEIGPWDFPLGTPAWTAAMLELQEKRKSSEVHTHFTYDGGACECERCKRGIPHGPNDISVQIQIIGGDAPCASEKAAREPREAVAPLSEASPLAQHERSAADANSAAAEPDERLADAMREERLRAYIDSRKRRPSVHKPSYRRHRWPSSA